MDAEDSSIESVEEIDFQFDDKEDFQKTESAWDFSDTINLLESKYGKKVRKSTVDDKIREKLKRTKISSESSSEESSQEDIPEIRELKPFQHKKPKDNSYFLEAPELENPAKSFEDLNLSRPLLKAISEIGWNAPTPVQQQAIPIGLTGKDIAASAATGSGKTGAFLIPALERMIFRDVNSHTVRVLILTPTRELAAQCHSVINKLTRYCNNIRASLILGGFSLAKQTVELRSNPDIIVATPGRILDHLINTKSFGLEDLEILILDEADRLLELGFTETIEEIVRLCPINRHTMLFSATMTDKVSQLMKLSLKDPVKVEVDQLYHTSKKLRQEFIRIRKGSEDSKEAILLALCKRNFKSKTIIFCAQKITAHRLRIMFSLAGLKASELHGNMTQLQRLEALEEFKNEKVDFLVATDLASRGIDVIGVETVINFDMPNTLPIYIHRVGRTARAGKTGVSVSMVTEDQRKLLKEVIKHSKEGCKNRIIPPKHVDKFSSWIEKTEEDIAEILEEERIERTIRQTEMHMQKEENMITYHDEIHSRPARKWFMNESEKQAIKDISKRSALGLPSLEEEFDAAERKRAKLERKQNRNIPILERPKTRRERRREGAETVSKGMARAGKKINKDPSRRAKMDDDRPKKKRKIEQKEDSLYQRRKKGAGGSFKSEKRYKRRR